VSRPDSFSGLGRTGRKNKVNAPGRCGKSGVLVGEKHLEGGVLYRNHSRGSALEFPYCGPNKKEKDVTGSQRRCSPLYWEINHRGKNLREGAKLPSCVFRGKVSRGNDLADHRPIKHVSQRVYSSTSS